MLRKGFTLKEISDALRCLAGIHCVPQNWCFEECAAIFEGGICPRCGKLKQGKFLGNLWTEEVETEYGIELRGSNISSVTDQGYVFKGSLCALEEEYCVVQGERKRMEKEGKVSYTSEELRSLAFENTEFSTTRATLARTCDELERVGNEEACVRAKVALRNHVASASDADLEREAAKALWEHPEFDRPFEFVLALLREHRERCRQGLLDSE